MMAGALTAAVGVVVGIPSLRVKGLYLAIATIAASVILHFVFANWTLTGEARGLSLPPARLFGAELDQPAELYWLIVPITVLMVVGAANLFRTRIGRAFIAIRDRDISAEVLGIPLLQYKLMSFALSSFYAGLAGGLWAYFFRVVTPESFPLINSIFYLAAIIVGGMGTILGGILGAAFMTMMPEALKLVVGWITPWFPDALAALAPIRTIVFGALIVGFLIFGQIEGEHHEERVDEAQRPGGRGSGGYRADRRRAGAGAGRHRTRRLDPDHRRLRLRGRRDPCRNPGLSEDRQRCRRHQGAQDQVRR
jgi:branched-chain amino acid transport system permease protein